MSRIRRAEQMQVVRKPDWMIVETRGTSRCSYDLAGLAQADVRLYSSVHLLAQFYKRDRF
jgi:hypothetical protein